MQKYNLLKMKRRSKIIHRKRNIPMRKKKDSIFPINELLEYEEKMKDENMRQLTDEDLV